MRLVFFFFFDLNVIFAFNTLCTLVCLILEVDFLFLDSFSKTKMVVNILPLNISSDVVIKFLA